MTKLNAEKAAAAQSKILRQGYAVVELASGEFIPMRLPFKVVSKWVPEGEWDSKQVEFPDPRRAGFAFGVR